MEDHQSTQQQSPDLKHSKLARTDRRPKLLPPNLLVALLKRYPWLLWSGMWVLLLSAAAFISSIAIFSLMHTGRVAHQELPQPIATENPAKASQTTSTMFLWVLGAVALTCSAAGYLASQRSNSSSSSAKPEKPVKRSAARIPTRRQRRRRSRRELLPSPPPPEPKPITPPVPAEIEPVVTVLPPEESHPLDTGEESLAEMMDIRKQRSLSSILDEPFKEK